MYIPLFLFDHLFPLDYVFTYSISFMKLEMKLQVKKYLQELSGL